MGKHRNYFVLLWGTLLLIMILDSRVAMESASEAISLCIRCVIPSLFPMMFLGGLLTGHLGGRYGLFLVGILGGYPVGAKCIAQAYDTGVLSQKEAQRMLGYCNNPGPSFIFGILGPLFSSPVICWVIWVIIIFSSLLTAITLPGESTPISFYPKPTTPADSLQSSLKALAGICGWVILFRVLIGFLEKWMYGALPELVALVLTGMLELTNGCLALNDVVLPGVQYLLAVLFLTGGGICVAMQTRSVTGHLGLGMYLPGKAIQCSWAMLLASFLHPILFSGEELLYPIPAISVVFLLILRFSITERKITVVI